MEHIKSFEGLKNMTRKFLLQLHTNIREKGALNITSQHPTSSPKHRDYKGSKFIKNCFP